MVTLKKLFVWFVSFLLRHFVGDKRSQLLAIAGCSACEIFGQLGCDAMTCSDPRCARFRTCQNRSSGGMVVGFQRGDRCRQKGYMIHFVDYVGYTPRMI